MKIKIGQYYIGNDKDYLELYNLTSEYNKKYCNIHGYKFTSLKLDKIDCYEGYDERWTNILYKLQFIYDNLNSDCDWLVFFDSDLMVVNPGVKIENLIDESYSFFYTRGNGQFDLTKRNNELVSNLNKVFQNEEYRKLFYRNFVEFNEVYKNKERFDFKHEMWYYTIASNYINEGFFIIKNDKLMKDFFRDAISLIPYFNGDFNAGIDGTIINFLLNNRKYKNAEMMLPDWIQQHVIGQNENRFNIEKCFLMHNYGCISINDRILIFKQLTSNKYWKSYL